MNTFQFMGARFHCLSFTFIFSPLFFACFLGGGLLIPIFLLVFDFTSKQATVSSFIRIVLNGLINFTHFLAQALSLATITGGAIAQFWLNFGAYHPVSFPQRPLIDYDAGEKGVFFQVSLVKLL